MISTDELEWSQQLFAGSDLGDTRRTERLVDVAARMAGQMGRSLAKSCEGEPAALLGGYRLIRNGAVEPEAIRDGGFESAAKQAQTQDLLLAVEDSTSISYTHAVATELGTTGSNQDAKTEWVSGAFGIIAGCGERTDPWLDSATTLVPRSR